MATQADMKNKNAKRIENVKEDCIHEQRIMDYINGTHNITSIKSKERRNKHSKNKETIKKKNMGIEKKY